MKKVLVVATLLVSGLAWGNPVDLTQSQVICNSALEDVTAALLTGEVSPNGETGFLYVEDSNKDGAFSQDEFSEFQGVHSSSGKNEYLSQLLTQINGAKAFGTIQEINANLGNYIATFIYGFEIDGYEDVQFAVLTVKESAAQGKVVFSLPLYCQEYVPQP